jgi:hypothetical protein
MNGLPRVFRFWTAMLVILSLSAIDIAPAAAGLAPSRASGATSISTARDADMLVATRALENRIVAQKLRDYGVNPADAQVRLASMTDQELHTLASSAKGLPSGGDGTTGAIIGVLVVVILVIVVLRLMNREVVVR